MSDVNTKTAEEVAQDLETELRELLDTRARDYAVAALAHLAAVQFILTQAAADRRLA